MPEIESHRSIEYQVVDRGPQKEGFTVDKSPTEDGLEVSGVCPACHGRTTTPWSYGIAGGKGVFRKKRENAQPSGPRTVACECGYAHPNRPETAWNVGCGAYWTVELPS
ncbi:hypothetical protein E1286_12865 [Nonomuraea terrae]|uniref:Uncharacterized protein n=1 Tax=Nonomuraea terrae TaxID=2530383 RepID=A0A4R4Z1V7_9ACTN|nr:hypothetical protein [Nonomuraea terrae]TDD50022.1 hypothetical protein E1286_12865 [Nonomuraea terrae]